MFSPDNACCAASGETRPPRHTPCSNPPGEAVAGDVNPRRQTLHAEVVMVEMMPMAAAGWAFLVWLFGGGLGLALIVFVVLKMLGK
jgi:hypothetical protein